MSPPGAPKPEELGLVSVHRIKLKSRYLNSLMVLGLNPVLILLKTVLGKHLS